MSPSKALLIDATARTVSEVEFDRAHDGLQKLVGGYIETAFVWDNGDVLYVDEEGLLKDGDQVYFAIHERQDQVLAGNGVIVGREEEGEQFEGGYTTHPPTMTLAELRRKVLFLGVLR